MPVKDILSKEELDNLIKKVEKNEGKVSYKTNSDGSTSPYEMNINYFDALYDEEDSMEENINKFLGAYFIAFSLRGIPGIYIHSLIGSRNWVEGIKKLGYNRAINREKLDYEKLKEELEDRNSLRYKIFNNMKNMLEIRKRHNAFSPKSEQEILNILEDIFVVKRKSEEETIIAITNLSPKRITIDLKEIFDQDFCTEIIRNKTIKNKLTLESYEYAWVKL
jgi:sucrose phosphorylase